MSRVTLLIVALASLLALSACGQRAELVAPGDLDGQKTTPVPEKAKQKSPGFLLD